ncbi:MAG TPA: hypothetical protein VFE10_00515 [Phenylobacterium sp.]|nr:hypothetical protein [Phenylobacterium sp.]
MSRSVESRSLGGSFRPPIWSIFALGVLALLGVADARAAERPGVKSPPDYGQDLISVVTGQHEPTPTGNCIVWANAEGLGVGRAQLGGYHGVSMNIDLKPMGKDGPVQVSFPSGLAELKSRIPTTPDWLVKTLQKHQAAIEAACVEDHETPFVIHKIIAADQHD